MEDKVKTDDHVFLEQYSNSVIERIRKGEFSSKQDLQNELISNQRFSNAADLREDLYSKILREFDQYESNHENDMWSSLKEQVTKNGNNLATFTDEKGQNYTVQNDLSNNSLKDQINDVVNQEIMNGANAPKSVEDAFKVAREKVKIEEHFYTENQISGASKEVEALIQYFNQKGITDVEFSGNNLARDREGNLYEATMDKDGKITVLKTKANDYSQNPVHQQEQTLTSYENTDININMLNELYNDPDWYQKIMNSNLPADQKYVLIDEISRKKQEEQNQYQYQNELKPKVYQLKNNYNPYNGFIQVILLSMITLLFGMLCVTNIFFEISGK